MPLLLEGRRGTGFVALCVKNLTRSEGLLRRVHLLVGDAAGLMREYGEGIFPAVVSGIEAGKAVRGQLA